MYPYAHRSIIYNSQNMETTYNRWMDKDVVCGILLSHKKEQISVIQVYALTSRSLSWMVLWRLIRPFRTNTKNRCPFHYRDGNAKVGSQETPGVTGKCLPWSTEWGKAKANSSLPRERTGHSKHPLPTTQEKTRHMDITRWSTLKSDWLYSLQPKMEKLYTVSKNKIGSWLWLRSWTPYFQIQI